jgi:hypothetical protein
MAYLGTKPANAVLTSEQIGDGVIATADLANGAVTQDKLSTYIAPKGTPAFSAYGNATQNPTLSTWTKVLLQVEDFDTNNNFASSTFTPTVAGYYQINARVRGVVATTFTGLQTAIYKNGVSQSVVLLQATLGNGYNSHQVSDVIYMNGTTDYLEVYTFLSGTGTVVLDNPNPSAACRFSGSLVRAA